MATGTINIRCRPVKLGFVVSPSDTAGLLKAMELSTFLWGGTFNPIIPVLRRLPRAWMGRPAKNQSCKEMLHGYVDAYDPDVLVYANEAHKGLLDGSREVLSMADILSGFDEHGSPKHGIGLPEVMHAFLQSEMKYVRRHPVRMCIPVTGRQHRLLVTSIFGVVPAETAKITQHCVTACDGEYRSYSHAAFVDLMHPSNLFLRRLSMLATERQPQSHQTSTAFLFFFDASDPLDVIDYWNLRALGPTILPVPQQVADKPDVHQYALEFIRQFYREDQSGFPNHASLLCGARSSKQALLAFLQALEALPCGDYSNVPVLGFQHWYPRVWDLWARDKDAAACWSVEHKSARHDVQGELSTYRVPQLDPDVLDTRRHRHGRQFANEIELRIHSGDELGAEVVPEAPSTMARAFSYGGVGDWRFSARGPVYLANYTEWSLSISRPIAEKVFTEWMKTRGWEITLSSAGRIARQMAKQLGGKWGLDTLAKRGLLSLLEKLSAGKTMDHPEILGAIHRIANDDEFGGHPELILKGLLDSNVLRLGFNLHCPVCQQHSWFSISEADYDVPCPKCLETFALPSHAPGAIQWSYRALGPFSLPKKSYGAYSVLLTLRFFSRVLDGATTPMLSFLAKKGQSEMEVDLGIFFQRSIFRDSQVHLIFAECKMHMSFKRKDKQKMVRLAKEFPGSVLVFSTLRSELTRTERAMLVPLVNRSRRARRAGRSFSHILVLTATELCADGGLGHTWQKAGGDHARHYDHDRDIGDIADATQQLYLGMEPWFRWLDRQRESRKPTRPPRKRIEEGAAKQPVAPRKVAVKIWTALREVQNLGQKWD